MDADRLGKYQLVQHLASGGMASVYLARLSGMGGFERHVVLKTLRTQEVDDVLVPMFLDEARLVATLHHKHIAQVFEVGRDDGTYFLAMEYVHGETTRQVLETARDRGLALPTDFALTVLCAAAAGLHHAHEQRALDGTPLGIVHRDVTPSNVIVSYDGSIKLIDFGIAKSVARTTVTRSGLIKGKVGYMAPEQVRGFVVDRRSDVFSLGVLAYELTTQTRPFDAATQFEQLDRTARGDLIPPSRIVANYPKALEDVILTALQVEPDDRYPNADTMRRALAQVARSLGLHLGEAPIIRVLANLFGSRPEPWLERRRRARVPTWVETPPLAIEIEMPAAFARSGSQPPQHAYSEDDDDAPTDPIELLERPDVDRRPHDIHDGSRAMTVPEKPAGRVRKADSGGIARGSALQIASPPMAPRTITARSIPNQRPPAPRNAPATEPPPLPRTITARSMPASTSEPPPLPRTFTPRSIPPASEQPPRAVSSTGPLVPRTITARSMPASTSEPPPLPRTITARSMPASTSEPPPLPRTFTPRSIPTESEQPPRGVPSTESLPRTITTRSMQVATSEPPPMPPFAPPRIDPRTIDAPAAPRTLTPHTVAPPTPALPASDPAPIAPLTLDPRTIDLPTSSRPPMALPPRTTAASASGSASAAATNRMVAPRGLRRFAIIGGSMLLALALATAAVIGLDTESSDVKPPPRASEPQASPAPSPAPAPAETIATTPVETIAPTPADHVMLHVVTDPPGATVVLDGVRLGTSPYDAEVPIKHGGAWLKVRKRGHRAVKLRVSLEQDVTWDVSLPARR